jgi:filamentous hemagglutinin
MQENGISAARWQSGLTVEDLAAATSRGHAAIAQLDLSDGASHFVVVDGVTVRPGLSAEPLVAVRDPWNGSQYFAPVSEFQERFVGVGVLTNEVR